MAQRQTTSVPLRTLSLGLALSVFLADLMLPVGIVASIPYIAVVLLAARFAWRGYPVMVALGCTGLTILGWVYALPGSFVWMDITNRGLVMSAIWVVVSLVRQHLPGSTSSSPTSTMPAMTGVTLARELRRIRPDLPIILCSGSDEGLDPERATAQGIAAVLLKPWSPQDLARTIQRVCEPSHR